MKIEVNKEVLPLCMYCKKIRDDSGVERGRGRWIDIKEFAGIDDEVRYSHSCCPECFDQMRQEWLLGEE